MTVPYHNETEAEAVIQNTVADGVVLDFRTEYKPVEYTCRWDLLTVSSSRSTYNRSIDWNMSLLVEWVDSKQYRVVYARTRYESLEADMPDINSGNDHDDRLYAGGSYMGRNFDVEESFFGDVESALTYAADKVKDISAGDKRCVLI